MILNNAVSLFVGERNVDRVYRGENVVWRRGLPEGFTRVAYLENNSSGKQYIDTGVVPSLDMIFETKIYITSVNDDYFCSVRVASGDTRYYLLNMNEKNGFVCTKSVWHYGSVQFGISGSKMLNQYFDIKSKITDSRNGIYIGDDSYTFYDVTQTISNKTLPLFGAKLSNSEKANTYSPYGTRCCYARFTDGGKVVRDFVPAIDPNGRPCMYDLVTRQPFYNQGTGEFTYSLTE